MNRRVGGRIFRVLVAAGLTLYLLRRSDPAAVGGALAGANAWWVLLSMLLLLADRTLMAERWIMLLCIVDERVRPRLARLVEIFLVSTFVGTFLPASI